MAATMMGEIDVDGLSLMSSANQEWMEMVRFQAYSIDPLNYDYPVEGMVVEVQHYSVTGRIKDRVRHILISPETYTWLRKFPFKPYAEIDAMSDDEIDAYYESEEYKMGQIARMTNESCEWLEGHPCVSE